jgi:hypothetical protein
MNHLSKDLPEQQLMTFNRPTFPFPAKDDRAPFPSLELKLFNSFNAKH